MEINIIILSTVIALLVFWFLRQRRSSRLQYIENYQFHPGLEKKLRKVYPHLNNDQIELVFRAMRDYFYICHQAKRKMVAMPSQVVDVLWHEFILTTRAYELFCQKAFGYFLHHTPTEAMNTPVHAQEGIKRTWRLACHKARIRPDKPSRLPLLFAIDSQLQIDDGFKYSLNCSNPLSPNYGVGFCAGDIGCSSGCVGDSGSSSGHGGFFDSFGDSGGSGCGSSCGGGCGGGGD
ncbi:glycine-rich domain-containing protein [Gynuella sp.]|uniref:glycine-rich domain-containing protein n=1 Tax=Gynuella sp. TaxID=2969146 RepID=UPI003D0E2255